MQELSIIELSAEEMAVAIPELPDDRLDWLIETTDNAAVANRLARIERGRRIEKQHGEVVTPGMTLTGAERNKRSEERIVAEYDPTPEEVERLGWKKIVGKARAHRRETTIAAPEVVLPVGIDDWSIDDDFRLLHGDFRKRLKELPDGSVDLIVTDPPYPQEDLSLWGDLAEEASRLLGPRGILFAMTGQIYLPQVMDHLGGWLNYGWTYNYAMPSGNQSRIMGRHIIQTWKPVLAYTVGTWPSGEWGKDTMINNDTNKDLYEWQQGQGTMQILIERHCPPGGLVVDPFLGVGTYGLDALHADRRFIGVECDAGRFEQSVERIDRG